MNKETNYPDSCEGCPNNPDSYELTPEGRVAKEKALARIVGIELANSFINEMGGSDE